MSQPLPVHLVGSIPLADAESVMRLAGERLGPLGRRIPDGETGERGDWIQYLVHVVSQNPDLEHVIDDSSPGRARHYHRPRHGVSPDQIAFGRLGYADHARRSYAIFHRLREEGVIAPDARFLVAMPTPMAFLMIYIMKEHRRALEPAFLACLRGEVAEIVAAVPAQDLVIQWDAVFEFLVLDGARNVFPDETRSQIIDRLVQVADMVPPEVGLGFHFCYGDFNHRHSVEPGDMGIMVDAWNDLRAGARRKIDYVHMPVPRGRDDDAYFAPLRRLRREAEEIYLGLIHFSDGLEGGKRRMMAARGALTNFGIATECGFGRRPPETIPRLFDLHVELAADNSRGE